MNQTQREVRARLGIGANRSWRMLRAGLEYVINRSNSCNYDHAETTSNAARSMAYRCAEMMELAYDEILDLLDANHLGVAPPRRSSATVTPR